MAVYIDANIFIRFFTQDDPAKAAKCEQLFRDASDGKVKLNVTDVCIAEIVWTLSSYYGLPKDEICRKLIAILNTPGFEFSNTSVLLDAVRRFDNENVDYIDAYHAAVISAKNSEIYSYDRDFDKFKDICRREP